jgi:hypoxanthine phosphoribosyltransferase
MKIQLIVFMVFMSLFNSLKSEEVVRSLDVSPFDYSLEKIISGEEIASRIEKMAKVLEQDYKGQEIYVLAILKGSLWFATDLIQVLKLPNSLGTVSCSSYGSNGMVSGNLTISGFEKLDISNKHVIVIDDICDTGKTLSTIVKKLQELKPKSLKSMVLLSKKNSRTVDYQPDYTLFEIENLFVVGYGLDYKEYYRGLSDIYILSGAD